MRAAEGLVHVAVYSHLHWEDQRQRSGVGGSTSLLYAGWRFAQLSAMPTTLNWGYHPKDSTKADNGTQTSGYNAWGVWFADTLNSCREKEHFLEEV